MATPYELLLRWKDGKFSGGHAIYIDGPNPGNPEPLGGSAHPWPDVLKGINTDAIAGHQFAVDAQKAAEAAQAEAEERQKAADAALVEATDRIESLEIGHTLTVEDLGKTIDGLNDSLAASKNAISGLTEQLRIAKLPPADQQKLALEDEMVRLEAETQRVKALHAAILDPK